VGEAAAGAAVLRPAAAADSCRKAGKNRPGKDSPEQQTTGKFFSFLLNAPKLSFTTIFGGLTQQKNEKKGIFSIS
jgi:hypothetical protein